ncbi:MAG: molybdate ABC transporter substrate-binding protein [Limisphaerales bacterium]
MQRSARGSSGNFFAQIQRGAPFDVFLSADASYPQKLIESKTADAASLTPYAVGRLVLWTMNTNLLVTDGLNVLTNVSVRKIAIASPEHAPYGRAAKAALESVKLWEPLQPKIVLGENIAQTAQFVQTGNADAGLIALSLVSAPKLKNVGRWWLVPETLHPRLEQAAVLTMQGAENPDARAYLEFLRSPAARKVFDQFGFRLPEK